MSENSIHHALPYIQGGQAQKHVTHNEAIRALDALVQISVKSRASDPAASPEVGDRFIVDSAATGAFEGCDGKVATWENAGWTFLSPRTGWVVYEESTGTQLAFTGSAWAELAGGSGAGAGLPSSVSNLGINTESDATNRLAAASDATLLTHDTSGGHQLKVNKAAPQDTASLLFQTGFSGRAEMGTTGSDDFAIKVSADGTSFHSALQVNSATGAVTLPNTNLANPAFGAPEIVTRDYIVSRASGLVTNGSGYLGNGYNFPPEFVFGGSDSLNLPGAFSKAGHYSGFEEMSEFMALDPNRLYRTSVYVRQDSAAGDWSAFAQGDRHMQYMGFRCYDVDGLAINAAHHMRYRHNGTDSMTTLTSPLTPGDTTISVNDASGWNETSSDVFERGLIIFGYKNGSGRKYDYYSRIEEIDLFDLGGVDKSSNTIALNRPVPASLGNPDDPAGTWPAGTKIANRGAGWNVKMSFYDGLVLDQTDTWYRIENAIGGVDLSGTNSHHSFPPGTATVRPIWMVNYSNRPNGWSGFPDTGTEQKWWVSGVSVELDPVGTVTRAGDGSCQLRRVIGNAQNGSVSFQSPELTVRPLD